MQHKVTGAKDRPWHLRAWSGICFSGWMRVLARHRFRISPSRLPMAILLSGMSLINSILAFVQQLSYGRRIAETDLCADPIFIVGHWRAGTTLLHELLVLDSNFTFPNTYACFSPNHFLVSEWWLKRMIGLFLPRKRPMDNMAIGWDLPQEDEWALCNMGMPSPYFKIMFPNMPLQDRAYQSLRELSPQDRRQWQDRFLWLLKCLTVREPKRIILKTPVHTFRVASLLEIFPQARFIHITRDPFEVFPSTLHTWRRMYHYQGLQVPQFVNLEEEVLETFVNMYQVFEEDRRLLDSEQFLQLSYESLSDDPVEQLTRIYHHFNFPISSQLREKWQAYAERSSGYEKNRYEVTDEQRAAIAGRCAAYIQNYGYDSEVLQ